MCVRNTLHQNNKYPKSPTQLSPGNASKYNIHKLYRWEFITKFQDKLFNKQAMIGLRVCKIIYLQINAMHTELINCQAKSIYSKHPSLGSSAIKGSLIKNK